jgi:predicted nucleotidyltransferase
MINPKNEKEIMRLTNLLVEKFNPVKVILFGSQADGTATEDSDIDFCVIANVGSDIESRRDLRGNINSYLIRDCKSNMPIDVLVYNPLQWNERKNNETDFAKTVNEDGVLLYG